MRTTFLIRSSVATVLLIAIATSCTKLDQKVYSVVPESEFWQTPAQIAAGLAPAYQALTNITDADVRDLNEVSGGGILVPTRGNDWYDNGNWQALWTHQWKPDLGPIDGAWSAIFNGIGKVNFTLNAVNALSSKPSNIDAINAELKVLRAYYYFLAMDMFGQIPVVTDFNTDPATVNNSQSRSETYNFIVNEITSNIGALPDKTGETYGRMTKWGANALLAKLYLNAGVYTGTPNWEAAIAACDNVINSGKYSLSGDYLSNFAVSNEGSPENIFVVPFDKINIGGNNWEMRTLHYQSQLTYNLNGGPWNGYCVTADFYNQYDNSDNRKQMFAVGQQFGSDGTALNDAQTGLPLVFSKYVNELSNPTDTFRLAGARNVKYHPEAGTSGGQSNDMVVFRLADIYLMRAEAKLWSNTDLGGALADVNMVRGRAGVSAWSAGDLNKENLYHERQRELAWEGWGRNDAIRFGHFGDARTPGKPADADKHLELFPIPSPEISANGNLKQNPGY